VGHKGKESLLWESFVLYTLATHSSGKYFHVSRQSIPYFTECIFKCLSEQRNFCLEIIPPILDVIYRTKTIFELLVQQD
jgi:hypothetical protein